MCRLRMRRRMLRRSEPAVPRTAASEYHAARGCNDGIDQEVVIAVDFTVEIEIAVAESEDQSAVLDIGVDVEVIVAVELSVQVGIAVPGVLDEHGGSVNCLPAPVSRRAGGDAEDVAGFADGE